MNLEQLILRRSQIVEEAHALLEEVNREGMNVDRANELSKKHDGLMREFDTLDRQIKIQNETQLRSDSSRRPGQEDRTLTPAGLEPVDYGWRDQFGHEVPILRPEQGMADALKIERGDLGQINAGGYLRALIFGAKSQDEKRALSEGTDTAGGHTVPAPLASEFIDRLRSMSIAINAGARTVPVSSETLKMARVNGGLSFAFRAENASISESDPTFNAVTFTPKSCAALCKVSRELVQDSANIDEILLNEFSKAGALVIDQMALEGDGSSNSPIGILSTSGINTLPSVGVPADFDDVLDAIYELETDNVPKPYGWAANPRTWRTYRKLKASDNQPLMMPAEVSELGKFTSTQMTIDSGSPDDTYSIVGHWPHLMIGMRNELQIEVLRERYADDHQIGFIGHMRFDIQLAHPESFCSMTGIRA